MTTVLATVQKEIEKIKNSLKREEAILENIYDSKAVLEHIDELVESGKPLPEDAIYTSYEQWRDVVTKELKAYETSVATMEKNKQLLLAFEYYVENNTGV